MADLPSVTRILEAVGLGPDYSRARATDLEVARARGAAVHEAIEAEHLGYTLAEPLPDDWQPYLDAYHAFLKDSGYRTEYPESKVVSARWGYQGHPDDVGWLDGKRAILDYKCMASIPSLRPVARQLAGYRLAWNEQHPTEPVAMTAVLQLRPDATYRLHPIMAAEVEHVFLAAVTVYRARQGDTQ